MKHHTSEKWSDFVRGAASPRENAEMQKHLDEGCKECKRTAAVWSTVLKMARREAGYQPPDRTVRLAKSYFAMCGMGKKTSLVPRIAKLVFDSIREPLLAGVRSTGVTSRHFVYRSGPLLIDIWMEQAPEFAPMGMTGQILNQASPNQPVKDAVVMLWGDTTDLVFARTNAFGEFHLEVPAVAPAHLHLSIGDDEQITAIIPLPLHNIEDADDNK